MEFEPGQLLERAREIRALCRQIADVRARDELLRIAAEYELIAEAMRCRAQLQSAPQSEIGRGDATTRLRGQILRSPYERG
jgi:hypothetical protein